MQPSIKKICKECADSKKKEFESNVNIFEELENIKKRILCKEKSYVKVPFSKNLVRYYNPVVEKFYYYNDLDDSLDLRTEHMWVLCGDVNFPNSTVCGILSNEPVLITGVKEGDIVIVNFKDIEEIEYL